MRRSCPRSVSSLRVFILRCLFPTGAYGDSGRAAATSRMEASRWGDRRRTHCDVMAAHAAHSWERPVVAMFSINGLLIYGLQTSKTLRERVCINALQQTKVSRDKGKCISKSISATEKLEQKH